MKTKLFIIASLFLISCVNIYALGNYEGREVDGKTENTPVDMLSKKSYYQSVFSKKERKDLKKAEKYISTAHKYHKIYKKNMSQIERLEKIVEHSQNAKTKKKSLRKISKLRKKAYKNAYKAIDNYEKAISRKQRIYEFAADRIRLNDGSPNAGAGRQFEMQAKDVFAEADNLRSTSLNQQQGEKIETMLKASERAIYATILQSLAIANYKNDTSGNNFLKPKKEAVPETTKEEAKKVAKETSEKEPAYDPLQDRNIYRSRANLIIPKLNMSDEDLALLRKTNESQAKADKLLRKVDELYVSIDSLYAVAEKPENEFDREQIHGTATEKEMIAFAKLLQATKLYSSVNQRRYDIYAKYLEIIKGNQTNDKVLQAGKYVNAAKVSFQEAKSKVAMSKKTMSKPEQYIQLMGANELMLLAIQLQEEAFAIYLGLPQSGNMPIDIDFEVADNEVNADTKSDETVEKKANGKWEFDARKVYSTKKPKAVKYIRKKGVVFTVQLGFFKGILPPSKFGVVQPIIFDKFKNNPVKRYMVGEYRSVEAAELALKKVKKIGYKKAYIVALVNGYRKSLKIGKAKINTKSKQYKKWKTAELAVLNNGNKSKTSEQTEIEPIVSENPTYFTDTEDITQTKGLLYFVQLGMFVKPVDVKKDFKGLEPILYEKTSGEGRKYMLGTFGIYSVAKQEVAKLKYKGYKSAFVTAYLDGRHISLDEARKLEKEQYAGMLQPYNSPKKKAKKVNGKVTFAVQVGAFSRKMSAAEVENMKPKFSYRAVNHRVMAGKHVYYIGSYNKYKGAKFLKNRLASEGHKGVFIIAFRNNTKLKITDAMRK